MLRTSGFAILALVLPLASPCWSQELETCTSVHFAETGWTDLALTTETARHVLTALGYETKSDMLGLGIIYESLESGSIDAFLGYWPLAQVEFQPYYDRNAASHVRIFQRYRTRPARVAPCWMQVRSKE